MKPLACVSGLRKVTQSQPHGTNHAGIASVLALASLGEFTTIDVYSEAASIASMRGLEASGLVYPKGGPTPFRLFDVTDLFYSTEEYEAIYSAGGGLIGERFLYSLRPSESIVPVVCEIDCSHSRLQWMNLFLSGMLQTRRATDGLIFKSFATQRLYKQVLSSWSERFGGQKFMGESIVSPNPISCAENQMNPELRSKVRSMLGIAENEVVFLSFSRIERMTKGDGPSLLVNWRRVTDKCPQAVLVISGVSWDNEYLIEIRSLCRELGVSDRVVIVPNPYDWIADAKNALMSAADAFLHISTGVEESAPLTVLEAMAHKLPCVVAGWSGMPEQISHGRTGFVVPVLWSDAPLAYEDAFYGCEWLRSNREASQFATVQPALLIEAIVELASNNTLRLEMGNTALNFVAAERSPTAAAKHRAVFVHAMAASARAEKAPRNAKPGLVSCTELLSGLAPRGRLDPKATLVAVSHNNLPRLEYWLPPRLIDIGREVIVLSTGQGIEVGTIVDLITNGVDGNEVLGEGMMIDSGLNDEASLHVRMVILRLIAGGFVVQVG